MPGREHGPGPSGVVDPGVEPARVPGERESQMRQGRVRPTVLIPAFDYRRTLGRPSARSLLRSETRAHTIALADMSPGPRAAVQEPATSQRARTVTTAHHTRASTAVFTIHRLRSTPLSWSKIGKGSTEGTGASRTREAATSAVGPPGRGSCRARWRRTAPARWPAQRWCRPLPAPSRCCRATGRPAVHRSVRRSADRASAGRGRHRRPGGAAAVRLHGPFSLAAAPTTGVSSRHWGSGCDGPAPGSRPAGHQRDGLQDPHRDGGARGYPGLA